MLSMIDFLPAPAENHGPMYTVAYKDKVLTRQCTCTHRIYRSTRHGMKEFLFSWIGRYPFRCWECGRRFYRFRRR
jgi:hypothetical protein